MGIITSAGREESVFSAEPANSHQKHMLHCSKDLKAQLRPPRTFSTCAWQNKNEIINVFQVYILLKWKNARSPTAKQHSFKNDLSTHSLLIEETHVRSVNPFALGSSPEVDLVACAIVTRRYELHFDSPPMRLPFAPGRPCAAGTAEAQGGLPARAVPGPGLRGR